MYEYIKGKITELTPTYAVVETAGTGYYLVISLNTYTQIETLSETKIYIHYTVREDAQVFYGFADKREREIFRLLIGVSGVGGNTARMILSTYSPSELTNIISTENAVLLKNVKGLGMKTSQKIIVELKDKIISAGATAQADSIPAAPGNAGYDEAMAALIMLGFPKAASDKAVKNIMKEDPAASVEEIVRKSLKKL